MDPLSVTASIIAILQLSSKVGCYLNDVKDVSKDRAKCAIEAANLNSLLTTLRFRLEEGRSNTPWHTAVRALATENGPLDQFKQALEELQSKLTGGTKMKKVGDALIWKFKKEEISSILDRMERLKTLVEIALQMDHYKLSQAIKEECSLIRAHASTINSGLETIRQAQGDARHSELVKWISTTDYPAQQSDIIGRREEGTGQWFLSAPEFARWLRDPKETLFCPGIPGAGKTMISAIVIDHLLRTTQSGLVGVAYVYFNYKAKKDQDATSMLAAILKQLVQSQPSLVQPLEQLHKQHAKRGTRPSNQECSHDDGNRHQFLTRIRTLQSQNDVRLMATSRFIPEIVREFEKVAKLEVRATDDDVRRFVAGQVYRLPNCIQRNSGLQNMVKEKIAEAADGMFLLARLHTDSLLDKRTPKDVKLTLGKFSKGSTALDDAYKEAIQRIEGQLPRDNQQAKTVLSWITYAQRPLTTAEMCCALAVEQDEEELDPENIPDVEELLSICAGLVIVDEESAIIRLVHYTTQEYFERIKEEWNPGAQLHIASTCLSYLSFNTFREGSSSSDQKFESRLAQNVFLDYAARYWGQHAAKVQDEVYELACTFLMHRGLISCAVQVMTAPNDGWKIKGYSQQYRKNTTWLHVMAQFGLHALSKMIFDTCRRDIAPSINGRDSVNQSPLYVAAKHGQESMVKLLLDKGADGANVNAQGGVYGNSLQAASEGGHEQIVKLLLDKGADVNAQGGVYGNALQAASSRGREQIVKLLLDNSAAFSS
ncbi:ankyrin [Lindgomyces ingoldianus]|uniref:Ankyrin n=1 Tax=Lindgomyces ingoldianus TaxID=673940 RepID=A0ACB6QU32_9PLEO|nr:ankyrin [Lindgomyces ingoldianus]KAF2470523.1 ankyrin [Lindgomyces ingoldianus]